MDKVGYLRQNWIKLDRKQNSTNSTKFDKIVKVQDNAQLLRFKNDSKTDPLILILSGLMCSKCKLMMTVLFPKSCSTTLDCPKTWIPMELW